MGGLPIFVNRADCGEAEVEGFLELAGLDEFDEVGGSGFVVF